MAVLEQIDAQGLSEYYFEDYASYIFDLAANASFYFNDKGLTIVFAPAVIAPYAASAQKFEIPYSRFYNALDAHTQSLLDVPQDEIIIADYYTTKNALVVVQHDHPARGQRRASASRWTVFPRPRHAGRREHARRAARAAVRACQRGSLPTNGATGRFVESDGALTRRGRPRQRHHHRHRELSGRVERR